MLNRRRIRKPIILVGAGRSGTSLLARIVQSHPDVAYLPEPRPIWMHGNAYRRHHALGLSDLTPRIAEYIDRRFAEFLEQSGATRLAEKTPSNCLRIPFIHALYEDCRVVNILRDGLAVVRSTVSVRGRPANRGTLQRRLASTPWWEWPGYLSVFWNQFVRTNLLDRPARHWGAQPPGWERWRDLPPHLAAAHQWVALVEASLRDGRALPAENYLELRYEELVAEPIEVADRLAAFAELSPSAGMRSAASERVRPDFAHRRRGALSAEREREVLEVIAPLQERLGYPCEVQAEPAGVGTAPEGAGITPERG